MDFKNYVNFLKEKNILLFDYQYRLSHFKLNKLNKLLKFNNQFGGSGNNINIFKNKTNEEINNIVNISLENNIKLGYLYYLIYNNL